MGLSAIVGLALLDSDRLDAEQTDYLRTARESATHLLDLLNDILDISKLEAGKVALEQVKFDLEQMLDDVVSVISEKAASKGLELVIEVADSSIRYDKSFGGLNFAASIADPMDSYDGPPITALDIRVGRITKVRRFGKCWTNYSNPSFMNGEMPLCVLTIDENTGSWMYSKKKTKKT